MTEVKSKSGEWSLKKNLEIYVLKLDDSEGSESIWLTSAQLLELKAFLDNVDLDTIKQSL